MAFREIITKTTLGILGTTLLVLPVHADDKLVKRQPDGQWQVESVLAEQAGKRPYCVMIQPYNNGGQLTLSRNHKRQTALAFNLGREFMNSSQNYTVAIKPDNNDTHRYDITPLSASEFILRMGADSETFDQIRRASSLRVSVAGQDFDIDLPDMKVATRSLSGCVQQVTARAKASDTDQTKSAGTDTSLAKLRAQNSQLRQSLKDVRKKLEDARSQSGDNARLAELKEKVSTLEGKLAKARQAQQEASMESQSVDSDKLAGLREELSTVKAKRQQAQETISDLRDKLSSQASDQSDKQSRISKLRAQNAELRQSLEDMRKKLEDARSQSGGKARVTELEEKVSTLENELAKARQAQQEASEAKSDEADKLANLREELSTVKAERQQAQETISDLRDKLSSQASEQSDKKSRLSEMQAQNEELRQSLKDMRKKLENARSQSGGNARVAELKEKVSTLEGKLARSRQAQQEASKESESGDAEKLADLREKLSAVRKARQQAENRVETLQKKLASKEGAPEQLREEKARLEEKITRLREEKARLAQKQAQADPRVASLRDENRRLKQKLDQSETRLANQSAEQCMSTRKDGVTQERVEELKSRVSRLRDQNERLKSDLASAQSRLQTVMAEDSDSEAETDGANHVEVATRYHEAQREIRRLGSKLREKRQSCQKEVKELENMLFDPRLAESKQISVLNKLEGKLKKARAKIEKLTSQQNNLQTASVESSGPVAPTAPVQSSSIAAQDDSPNSSPKARGGNETGQSFENQAVNENQDSSSADRPTSLRASGQKQSSQEDSDEDAIGRIARDLDEGRKIYKDKETLASLLDRADISTDSGVTSVSETRESVYSAFQWDQGSVYGSAKFRTIADKQSFGQAVDSYLATARGRCPADFSARPGQESAANDTSMKISSYDIACVGDDVNNAASLVFVRDGNTFGVLAFESGADQMGTTMQYRDVVMQTVASTKTAQR